jgi:hypothetical protein
MYHTSAITHVASLSVRLAAVVSTVLLAPLPSVVATATVVMRRHWARVFIGRRMTA